MTLALDTPIRREWLRVVAWTSAAAFAGILAGLGTTELSFLTLAVAVLGLSALITPLAVLIVMLIVAPLRTLIATESSLQLPLDIGQLALLGTLASWMLTGLLHQRLPQVRFSPIFLAVIVFISGVSLSAYSALSMSVWLSEWLKWVQVLVLVAICLDLGRRHMWRWLVFGLVLAAASNALVGIYQFFGGSGALHLLINDRFFRAFGTFGQPNPFGAFMGLVAPVALAASIGSLLRVVLPLRMGQRPSSQDLLSALFYTLSGIVISVALIMSWSRGAWLGFGVSLFVLLILYPRKLRYGLLFGTAAGLLIVGLWMTGRLPASIVERVSSAFQETFTTIDVRGVDINPDNYALIERLAHWQAAVNMATEHPWTGIGFGNYEVAYSDYRLINWKFPLGHAHNYYLNVLAEAGIIGLITFVAMLAAIVYFSWKARLHPDPFARLVVIGLIGSWTYLMVHSLTDNLFVNNLFLHLGVMFGILAVLYNQCHTLGQLRTE